MYSLVVEIKEKQTNTLNYVELMSIKNRNKIYIISKPNKYRLKFNLKKIKSNGVVLAQFREIPIKVMRD